MAKDIGHEELGRMIDHISEEVVVDCVDKRHRASYIAMVGKKGDILTTLNNPLIWAQNDFSEDIVKLTSIVCTR